MKSACQNLLAKRYGVDEVGPYWQKVEERYDQILDEAPDIGGEANSMSHNLYEVAWIIALYDVVGRNLTKEEIDTIIHDVMMCKEGLNAVFWNHQYLLRRLQCIRTCRNVVDAL